MLRGALARIDGAFVVDGIQHAGNFEVDAVERFAGDDAEVVDARNADVLPIDIQLFGAEHRQAGFDALPDFRIFAHDGDDAVGGHADEGERLEGRGGRLRCGRLSRGSERFHGLEMIGEKKAAASDGGNF